MPLGIDTALVERLRLDVPMATVKVATDGEIRRMKRPLEYRLERGALNVVVPQGPARTQAEPTRDRIHHQ